MNNSKILICKMKTHDLKKFQFFTNKTSSKNFKLSNFIKFLQSIILIIQMFKLCPYLYIDRNQFP